MQVDWHQIKDAIAALPAVEIDYEAGAREMALQRLDGMVPLDQFEPKVAKYLREASRTIVNAALHVTEPTEPATGRRSRDQQQFKGDLMKRLIEETDDDGFTPLLEIGRAHV